MRIGIDFGNCIVKSDRSAAEAESKWVEIYGALHAIRSLIAINGAENVYIISRVGSDKTRLRTLEWLLANDVYKTTGLRELNVFFCQTRQQKAPIIAELKLDAHIDDRPEVMAYAATLKIKILFNPSIFDLAEWQEKIGCYLVAANWWQVHQLLDKRC